MRTMYNFILQYSVNNKDKINISCASYYVKQNISKIKQYLYRFMSSNKKHPKSHHTTTGIRDYNQIREKKYFIYNYIKIYIKNGYILYTIIHI